VTGDHGLDGWSQERNKKPIERMAGKGRKSLIIDIRESEKAKGRKVGREAITMERLK
jgi:hypothetical protein